MIEKEELNQIFNDVKDFESENDYINEQSVDFIATCLALNEYSNKEDLDSVNYLLEKLNNKN